MSSKCIAEVFLVAENRLLREALVRLLAKKDIRVVGANLYSPAVVEEIARRDPDVILLDSTGLLPTQNVLSAIRARGVEVCELTLDVGLGTFQPIHSDTLEGHKMHAEAYEISDQAARQIQAARILPVLHAKLGILALSEQIAFGHAQFRKPAAGRRITA